MEFLLTLCRGSLEKIEPEVVAWTQSGLYRFQGDAKTFGTAQFKQVWDLKISRVTGEKRYEGDRAVGKLLTKANLAFDELLALPAPLSTPSTRPPRSLSLTSPLSTFHGQPPLKLNRRGSFARQ